MFDIQMQVGNPDDTSESVNWHKVEFINNSGYPGSCIKWFIADERIAKSRQFFRSFASVDSEKQRQLLLPYFVIHPFSEFRLFWEIWMIFIYFTGLVFIPFEACNYFYTNLNKKNFVDYGIPVIVIHALHIMDIIVSLMTGYKESMRHIITLERRKIVWRYLKTYFIVDVLSTIPALMNAISFYFLNGKPICKRVIIFNFFKILRWNTLANYCSNIAMRWKVHGAVYKVLYLIIFSVYYFHWTACGAFVYPSTISDIDLNSTQFESWVHTIAPELNNTPVNSLYFASLITAISLSLSCTARPRLDSILSLQLNFMYGIFGTLYICYIFVILHNLIRSKMEPETKYDEFVTELLGYMRWNQLPASVQKRMLLFYEHRFHRIYFNENLIMDTLSSNICKEIREVGVYRLLSKVKLFNTLGSEVVNKLVDSFVLKIFLPKDIIKTRGNNIYIHFILSGTVAIYTSNGLEVCHFHDGDYFGLVGALYKHRTTIMAMAVDVCEIYLLRRDIFIKTIMTDKKVYACVVRETRNRIKNIKAVETQNRRSDDKSFWEFSFFE